VGGDDQHQPFGKRVQTASPQDINLALPIIGADEVVADAEFLA
jgi:hypothetical protein